LTAERRTRFGFSAGALLCLLTVAFAASASSATQRPATALLLAESEVPHGFYLSEAPRLVSAAREVSDYGVRLAPFGRLSGAHVAFERDTLGFSGLDINIVEFRTDVGASKAFSAWLPRMLSSGCTPSTCPTFTVPISAPQSRGVSFTLLGVSLRNVLFRARNVLVYMSGGYSDDSPSNRELYVVVRSQYSKVVKLLRSQ
jgi:hypothetical protein